MSQMDYLNVYFSRLNHLGETTAERIRNSGIRSFEKWKNQSPHTVRQLSVERGIFFDGIILTNKDKEYQKIMFLNVDNNTPLIIGDIMNWTCDDGTEEKWILFQEQKKVNGTYRTFLIIRCNYLLKWIDGNGHLQTSWAYLVSSLDSKIKGNFRTWSNLITPQPNKYAEILMPRYPIDRATNFIVEKESWTVVQYDHTSVPGVIYLSLTEGKINSIYDNVDEGIADTDKLAIYKLSAPTETQNFSLGEKIAPTFTLTKNGVPRTDIKYTLISHDKGIAKYNDENELIAVGAGETTLTVQLTDYPSISTDITIIVNSEEKVIDAYIEGVQRIRLDRISYYTLKSTTDLPAGAKVNYSINNNLVTIEKFTQKDAEKYNADITCKIHANDKNLLGSCILTADYDGHTYTKTINIVPLWEVM